MANKVIHFEIQADDVDRAKTFYEKTFGWKIDKAMDEVTGGMDYWTLSGEQGTPGINGGMYRRPKDREFYTYDCTILVDDIDKAVQAVKDCGGQIQQEKIEMKGLGWFARGVDTEGNIFGLMQATEWQPS